MRPELLAPEGPVTTEVLEDAYGLIGKTLSYAHVSQWTRFERILAYDYAMRVHMRAGDSLIRHRPRPYFVTLAIAGAMKDD